jgi:hypothetical protein
MMHGLIPVVSGPNYAGSVGNIQWRQKMKLSAIEADVTIRMLPNVSSLGNDSMD